MILLRYYSLYSHTGPLPIFQHPWFHNLSGSSILPDQLRSWPLGAVKRYRSSPPGSPRGRDTAHKVNLGGRLWSRIWWLRPGQSSRIPAAGGKFDPLIGSLAAEVPMGSSSTTSTGLGARFSGGLQAHSCNCAQIQGGAGPPLAGKSMVDLYLFMTEMDIAQATTNDGQNNEMKIVRFTMKRSSLTH